MKQLGLIIVALAGSLAGGLESRAAAERTPVAVVWLAAPGASEALAKAAEAIDQSLVAAERVKPLASAEAKQALIEGGPVSRVGARLAEARAAFSGGRLAEATVAADQAEAMALAEIASAEIRHWLGEIESLRLLLADLARDDAAAQRAARLLGLTGVVLRPELAAAVSRHLPELGPSPAAPTVRVESEPPGADVLVDLKPVGKAPVDLPQDRALDALIDVELAGHLKVHRVAVTPGTWTVALRRDERVGPFVDRLRAQAHGLADASEAELTALGRHVGAERVLVIKPVDNGHGALEARVLDVAQGKWAKPALTLPLEGGDVKPGVRLAAYAGPDLPAQATLPSGVASAPTGAAATAGAPAAAQVAKPAAKPKEKGTFLGKKWYTWLIGGALVAVVIGLVVAQQVGSDDITVKVSH